MTVADAVRTPAADEETALADIIRRRSFGLRDIVLASGRPSTFYFNLKPTMMDPKGALYCGRALLRLAQAEDAELAGGLEMGAVPLLGAIAALSEAEGKPVRTFFVRKKAKEHGTQELVEGLAPDETLQGKRVLIIDDVATSGGSLWLAAEAVRAAGGVVDAGLVIVDREEGAREYLEERGMRLLSVFTAQRFLNA
ncbi:MAG TPA: orotate phosphoribosyltransferase [Caulobacteraceae bacterium]|jgi:orotate phosphoribosyltransferase|nr:orotate phosphoribosyltransferase [Caulobacteraceae bacterium]